MVSTPTSTNSSPASTTAVETAESVAQGYAAAVSGTVIMHSVLIVLDIELHHMWVTSNSYIHLLSSHLMTSSVQ